MQHRLGVGQRHVQARQVGAGDRVDQHGPCTLAPQLNEEGPVPVPEAGGPLSVDGDRSGATGERSGRGGQVSSVSDKRRQAIARLEQELDVPFDDLVCLRLGLLFDLCLGPRRRYACDVVPARLGGHGRGRRRGGRSAATPGASGGSPAAAQMTSHQAET